MRDGCLRCGRGTRPSWPVIIGLTIRLAGVRNAPRLKPGFRWNIRSITGVSTGHTGLSPLSSLLLYNVIRDDLTSGFCKRPSNSQNSKFVCAICRVTTWILQDITSKAVSKILSPLERVPAGLLKILDRLSLYYCHYNHYIQPGLSHFSSPRVNTTSLLICKCRPALVPVIRTILWGERILIDLITQEMWQTNNQGTFQQEFIGYHLHLPMAVSCFMLILHYIWCCPVVASTNMFIFDIYSFISILALRL